MVGTVGRALMARPTGRRHADQPPLVDDSDDEDEVYMISSWSASSVPYGPAPPGRSFTIYVGSIRDPTALHLPVHHGVFVGDSPPLPLPHRPPRLHRMQV